MSMDLRSRRTRSDHARRTLLPPTTNKADFFRVIAPYIPVQKKIRHEDTDSAHSLSFYLQKKPEALIRDLSSFMSDSVDLPQLLHETADVLQFVTKASSVNLYLVDHTTDELFLSSRIQTSDRYKVKWKIGPGATVAAHVAWSKDYVIIEDILDDDRFPEGIGYSGKSMGRHLSGDVKKKSCFSLPHDLYLFIIIVTSQTVISGELIIKSVFCVAVVTPDGDCFAVIELLRQVYDTSFVFDDVKITIMVTGWMGAAIYQNQQRLALKRQQELNDYLLNLTKFYFGDNVLMEKMITEIVVSIF